LVHLGVGIWLGLWPELIFVVVAGTLKVNPPITHDAIIQAYTNGRQNHVKPCLTEDSDKHQKKSTRRTYLRRHYAITL